MCSSKKGISSNQLARTLGVTIKTALVHVPPSPRGDGRLALLPPMGGEGATVEIDETFIGTKQKKPEALAATRTRTRC